MKIFTLYFLTFLTFYQDSNNKNYVFDYFLEYVNHIGISTILINSKDSSYYLIRNAYNKDNYTCLLKDQNSNNIEKYEIKNNTNSIDLVYIKTEPKKKKTYKNKYIIESIIEESEFEKKLTILAFSDKKKKKISRKLIVEFDKTEAQFSKDIIDYFFHGTLIDNEIKIPKGIPLKIIDTAGIRNTNDEVEQIGVKRSISITNDAELIIAVFDDSRAFDEEDEQILSLIKDKNAIILINKTDLNKNNRLKNRRL